MLSRCLVFGVLCCVPWIHLSQAQHCNVQVSPVSNNGKVKTCLHSSQDSPEKPHPDMSRLFSTDLLTSIIPHIEDRTCRSQLSQVVQDLNEMKLWAFQMFDSMGRLSSSVLSGNSHQLGDFDQCLSIQHPFIRPQYCLGLVDVDVAQEAPPDVKLVVERIRGNNFIQSHRSDPSQFIPTYTTLKWGLCIPDSCSPFDLSKSFDTFFNLTLPAYVTVQTSVDPRLCHQGGLQQKDWPLSTYLAM
uniref:Nose resistant-to-fluoxetine protein N-terminal domain-containing protein n=1 Tax=Cacopsylla melanoneura TaxID=428564 RepID=A0A8D8Q9G6_9HEMI